MEKVFLFYFETTREKGKKSKKIELLCILVYIHIEKKTKNKAM